MASIGKNIWKLKVEGVLIDKDVSFGFALLEFVVLAGEEALQVFARTHDLVVDHVAKEILYSTSAIVKRCLVVCVVARKAKLEWFWRDWWHYASKKVYLQSLNKPFKITVSPMDLNEWKLGIISQFGNNFVEVMSAVNTKQKINEMGYYLRSFIVPDWIAHFHRDVGVWWTSECIKVLLHRIWNLRVPNDLIFGLELLIDHKVILNVSFRRE